jgi:D-alanyl-D-alanine carboxypeptidase (penicillin-binding protein 5/6)
MPSAKKPFQEAIKFLNYGFARYTALSIADKGEVKASLPVLRGVQQELNLLCDRPLSVSVLKGEESTVSWELNLGSDQVLAPVAQGTKFGKIIVKKDGKLVTEVDLIAEKDIERLNVGGLLVRVFNSWLSGGTK